MMGRTNLTYRDFLGRFANIKTSGADSGGSALPTLTGCADPPLETLFRKNYPGL